MTSVENATKGGDNPNEEQNDVQGLVREMADTRGYHFPEFEWIAGKDEAYEKARLTFSNLVYNRTDFGLPIKYRELIVAVVLAGRGHPTVGVHVRRAIREGLTMEEALDGFESAAIPGGAPLLHFGLPFLIEIDKEQSEESS